MKTFTSVLLIALFCITSLSCDKIEDSGSLFGIVEIYEIETFETKENSFEIDESSVVLREQPLVKYEDLISYNSTEHIFTFSENGKNIIRNMQHDVSGIPFAVKALNELIYTGYFWPAYSSLSCDWLIIDPMSIAYSGKGKISLGYPGPDPNYNIPDRRNDPRILEIFRSDQKLQE